MASESGSTPLGVDAFGSLKLDRFLVESVAGTAFTDRISNSVAIDGIEHLAYMERGEDNIHVARFIRLFLHEAAHHTTYFSKLGYALSSLAASVLASTPYAPQDDGAGIPMHTRDLIVERWLFAVLEPLIEGIALFSEYDEVSGDTPVTTAWMRQAVALFWLTLTSDLSDDKDFADAVFRRLAVRLRQGRLTPAAIADKAYLLSQPIDGPHSYLLGYLAVKRVYLELRQRSAAAADPDFFLVALVAHFFGDIEFARRTLATDDGTLLSVQMTISELCTTFQDKWDALYQRPDVVLQPIMDASLDPDRNAHGGFVNPAPIQDMDFQIRTGLRMAPLELGMPVNLFKHSQVLRFGVCRAVVTTNQDRSTSIQRHTGGEPLLRFQAVPHAAAGTFTGSIEALISHSGQDAAIAVLANDGIVGLYDLHRREWNPPDFVAALDGLPPMQAVLDAGEMIHRAARAHESSLESGAAHVNADFREQGKQFARHQYLVLALPHFNREKRHGIASELASAGVAPICDSSAALNDLAALSLAFGGPGARIEEGAQALGWDAERVDQLITGFNMAFATRLGFDGFIRSDDYITSVI